jgi:hypothetical protein
MTMRPDEILRLKAPGVMHRLGGGNSPKSSAQLCAASHSAKTFSRD